MSKKTGIFITILSVIAIIISITTLIICIKPTATEGTADVPEATEALTEAEAPAAAEDEVATEALAAAEDAAEASPADIQYVMYLGTNDKDTNEPVFAPEEAMAKAKEILINMFGGYTIQEANGGWIDGDTEYQEYTLVIYLSDTDLEQVHKAADEFINEFHQSSVLIQANQTVTEFYSGNN